MSIARVDGMNQQWEVNKMKAIRNRQDLTWLDDIEGLISGKHDRRVQNGLNEVVHGLTQIVAGLEESAAFGERLKTINGEIVRQLVTGNTKLEV